jgi:hypothetical protein
MKAGRQPISGNFDNKYSVPITTTADANPYGESSKERSTGGKSQTVMELVRVEVPIPID